MKRPAILAAALLIFAEGTLAIELRAETVDAFNKFIASVELRLEPRFSGRHFLWSDEFLSVRQQPLNGVVIAQPVQGNGIVPLRGGLIQDCGFYFARQPAECPVHRAGLRSPPRVL